MARNLFAILDDLTGNLAELKAALAPLTLLGGKAAAQPQERASAQRRAKGGAPRRASTISRTRRAAMQEQGRYLAALRPLTRAKRAQVKKARAAKGAGVAIALAKRLSR